MNSKGIILSGIQPTGELHIGNYFGAIANWVRLQDDYKCFYTVVDLHAMTMPYSPDHLRRNTEQMVIDLLACGIDPARSTLFIQSLVPEHTELSWILGCLCSYGDLTRQTQFKEKSEQAASSPKGEAQPRDKFISAGLFTYPVLQAADILMYRANFVPVGRDQKQHLELTRDIAQRFNTQFGQYFPLPDVLFTDTPKIQALSDPAKKMSKQFGPKNYVGLFEDEDGIRAKVKAAVTDTGVLPPGTEMSEGVENLFGILRACGAKTEADALLADYKAGNRRYAPLKQAVADALVEFTRPLRTRREALMMDSAAALDTTREMTERARETARETLREVRALAGLPART